MEHEYPPPWIGGIQEFCVEAGAALVMNGRDGINYKIL